MKLIKKSFIATILAISSFNANAQKKEQQSPSPTKAETHNTERVIKSPKFSTSSVAIQPKSEGQSLLEELYSIEDQRHIIEKNQTLSSSDRNQQIEVNKSNYLSKRTEFINYINTNGILNVTKNEQNYYLSILKNNNDDKEYSRIVELIKNSK